MMGKWVSIRFFVLYMANKNICDYFYFFFIYREAEYITYQWIYSVLGHEHKNCIHHIWFFFFFSQHTHIPQWCLGIKLISNNSLVTGLSSGLSIFTLRYRYWIRRMPLIHFTFIVIIDFPVLFKITAFGNQFRPYHLHRNESFVIKASGIFGWPRKRKNCNFFKAF